MTAAGGSLSPEVLDELRSALGRALAEGERALAEGAADAKPVDLELSIGRVSRVDALQQQQMALATRQRAARARELAAAALGRIEAGTYGSCLSCDEPIALARLRAMPEAPLCRECQGRGAR